jgi:hypothetical protein
MSIFIRDEAHHFLLECWAEHHKITNGYKPKLFEHPIPKEFFNSKGGKTFKEIKPYAFEIVDDYIKQLLGNSIGEELIMYADNRMIMGDYRYGSIIRQSLNNYNLKDEYIKRLLLFSNTKVLDYLIDAYNMIRIKFFVDEDKKYCYFEAKTCAKIYNKFHNLKNFMKGDDDIHHETIK